MKVLHLCSSYPFTDLYKNLMKEIDNNRLKQLMYVPFEKNTLDKTRMLKNSNRIEYIFSQPFNKVDRYIYYSKITKIYNYLISKIEFKEISHVHAHFLFSDGGVAYKIKKKHNIYYTVAIRNADVNFFFKYGVHIRNYGIKILIEAKQVIFISPAYREFVINNFVPNKYKKIIMNKSFVIPNGIDKYWLDQINEPKKTLFKENSHINIISVGELNQNKNVLTSIQVISILKQKGYNVTFNVVGEGTYKDKILNEVKRQKLNKNIKLHGFISDKTKLKELYREADIYLMPSYKETFGLVYVEAMSQGLPVIYSNGQGIDGYFDDGLIGYSVDPRDSLQIVNRIESILTNYDLISKRASLEAQKFDWKVIAKKYIDLYKSN